MTITEMLLTIKALIILNIIRNFNGEHLIIDIIVINNKAGPIATKIKTPHKTNKPNQPNFSGVCKPNE